MNMVVEEARARKLSTVRGEYIKTPKNDMVKDFFQQFGFKREGQNTDNTHWVLAVQSYEQCRTFIAPTKKTTTAVSITLGGSYQDE